MSGAPSQTVDRTAAKARTFRGIQGAHRILVAAALHPDALARLATLFSVELTDVPPGTDRLADKSGVILAQHTPFPAAMLPQLNRLKAIGLTGAGRGRLDLEAMTEGGIRVTDAPLDDHALVARALWRRLERALNEQQVDPQQHDRSARDLAARSRVWGSARRPLSMPPYTPIRLRFATGGIVDRTLAGFAREAGLVGNDCLDPHARAGCCDRVDRGGSIDLTEILVLASPTIGDPPAAMRRIDLRRDAQALQCPDSIAALRDQLTVEGLIASLGIGRDSFHPRFLLNPEVCTLSCC